MRIDVIALLFISKKMYSILYTVLFSIMAKITKKKKTYVRKFVKHNLKCYC